MCNGRRHSSCFGCSHAFGRRGFLKRCGAAAAAVGGLASLSGRAEETASGGKKVRVALVFLTGSDEKEIWPYPGYDCETRHQEVIKLLAEGCPDIEWVPVVIKRPDEVAKAAALKDSVDGFLVYTVTLIWGLTGTVVEIGQLGKPTLVADEYLGGSGVFLVGYSRLCRIGVPAGAVSTTRGADLVTVAREFGRLKQPGMTPAAFAERCWETYRGTFAAPGPMDCREDKVPLTDIGECVKRLRESRFLIVGAGADGQERDYLGSKGIYVGFGEFQALHEKADRDQAAEWARRWRQSAENVVEPTQEWLQKAGGVYLAMLDLMKKYGTDSITMNCLGGFGSGQLPAYPCLGFMQLLDDGGQGVCEAMPDDSVSTLMGRILTGRAGYVSDPAIDTSKNQIVYSHCMALTKVFGPQGATNPFRIRTLHNRDPRGCCAQSFLPEGYMTTTFRTSIGAKKMVIHQAKAVGNLDADRGCRTQLLGEVRGDAAKLFDQWDVFGWHRVTLYGDVAEPLCEFGKALGLEIVEEA